MGDLENRSIAAAIPLFFRGMTDAVAKMLVEFWWLQSHDRFEYDKGGRSFEWRVRMRRGSPMGYTGVEGKTFSPRNDYEVASLPWRGIADGIVITWQEWKQIKGKEAIFNFVPQLLDDLKSDLLDRFGTDFYGDGTSLNAKTFHGLAASVGTTLTYAGLSQSTYTAWAAQSVSGAGFGNDPLAKLLSAKIAAAKGEKGGRTRNKISIFLTNSTDFQTIVNACQSQQRFVQNKAMLEAGFEDNVEVHGVPVAWSEYAGVATANSIYGLNDNLFSVLCTTEQLFESFTEWTVGLPKVYLGVGLSNFNLVNKNPRGSVIIVNTDT